MTEKELSLYNTLITRIERNELKLEELKSKEIPVLNGKVKGSSKYYPYIELTFPCKLKNQMKQKDVDYRF